MKKDSWKKKMAVIMAATLTASGIPVSGTQFVYAQNLENHLIINQVYGGGGKGDTPVANSFIELYNPADGDVSLDGYSIELDNQSDGTIEKTIDFTGNTIKAKMSYLITGKAETTSDDKLTYDLPDADRIEDDAEIDNKKYTIYLKQGDRIVDQVTADSKSSDKNLQISKQNSLRRINYTDTDQNSDWELVSWKQVDESRLAQYAPKNSKGEYGKLHVAAQQPGGGTTTPSGPDQTVYTPVTAGTVRVQGYNNGYGSLDMEEIARYNSGAMSQDGGSLEIVEYNSKNGYAYAVSGIKGKIIAVNSADITNNDSITELSGQEYDVKDLVSSKKGFTYGDITSVAISPDGMKLAAAVQHEDYAASGIVAVFDCKENGTLDNPVYFDTGIQPDMVTFADNDTILTADEGEPRNGFGAGATDPKGSVSIIHISEKTSEQVDFTGFTAEELTAKNILIGKVNGGVLSPETDLEPEYITVSSNGKTAYVSLQEANAVAVLDITQKKFTGIYSVGFEDYSKVEVDLDSGDKKYEAKTYDNLVGARMPDGIALYENAGKTYLITANEGDSRDWNGYCNEKKDSGIVSSGKKVTTLDPEKSAGCPDGKTVLFGGRSFCVFEVTENGLTEVYDSGSDFERITAEKIPDYFNCSNDDNLSDSRSGKKGPEPENVTVGTVNGKTYAFIAVERIGGIMVYDITDPVKASFVNYINSREFENAIQGDVSPEGLCFVEHKDGNPLLLVACEVSGTLAVYEMKATTAGNGSSAESSGSQTGSGTGTPSDSSNTGKEQKPEPEKRLTVLLNGKSGKSGIKVTLSGSVLAEIVKAAETENTIKVSAGTKEYTIKVNASDLKSGKTLRVVELNPKTGKYSLVNGKKYKQDKNGTISLTLPAGKTYVLINEKTAKAIEKEILKTVRLKKTVLKLKKGKKKRIDLSRTLDHKNIRKITYVSFDESIVSVSENGILTAKKNGKAKIKIIITLNNGKSKTLILEVRV